MLFAWKIGDITPMKNNVVSQTTPRGCPKHWDNSGTIRASDGTFLGHLSVKNARHKCPKLTPVMGQKTPIYAYILYKENVLSQNPKTLGNKMASCFLGNWETGFNGRTPIVIVSTGDRRC